MRMQIPIFLGCLITALLSNYFTPNLLLSEIEPVNLDVMIPGKFGDWRLISSEADVVKSPELEKAVKDIYSQVLSRSYSDKSGNVIMLSIAYTKDQSDNSGTQSHKPEICYPAQGFIINESHKSELNINSKFTVPIRSVLAIRDSRKESITYWTMVGFKPVTDGLSTKYAQILYGFKNIKPDGLLFRVSNLVSEPNPTDQINIKFISQLETELSKNNGVAKRIFGH